MCPLSRAQVVLSIETKAAIPKEWFDTERGKKADALEIATLFSRKRSFYTPY